MKRIIIIFLTGFIMLSCENKEKKSNAELLKSEYSDDMYKVEYSSGKENITLYFDYNNNLIFFEKGNKESKCFFKFQQNEFKEYIVENLNNKGVKYKYLNGLLVGIVDYKNIKDRVVNQYMAINNTVNFDTAFCYQIKEIKEDNYTLKLNFHLPINGGYIVIGDINEDGVTMMKSVSDTIFFKNNFVKFKSTKKAFEGIGRIAVDTNGGFFEKPFYFKYPNDKYQEAIDNITK